MERISFWSATRGAPLAWGDKRYIKMACHSHLASRIQSTNIETHLESFLVENPHKTYEEWISDLHHENLHEGRLQEGMAGEGIGPSLLRRS